MVAAAHIVELRIEIPNAADKGRSSSGWVVSSSSSSRPRNCLPFELKRQLVVVQNMKISTTS